MLDSLIPIINREQLESVATDFLRRHYPETLKTSLLIHMLGQKRIFQKYKFW